MAEIPAIVNKHTISCFIIFLFKRYSFNYHLQCEAEDDSTYKQKPGAKRNVQEVRKYIGKEKYDQSYQDLGYFDARIESKKWNKNIFIFTENAFQTIGK